MTAGGDDVKERALRAYAQAIGLTLEEEIAEELLAETIELLDELRVLASEDLGRLGMAVNCSSPT